MTSELSANEKSVFDLIFKHHDPDIETLQKLLSDKLIDKQNNVVRGPPDSRYVSKLKSTGLKKIINSLIEIGNSLRLDYGESGNPKKYSDKIKACVKGLNFMTNAHAFLIYTLHEGPIVWYEHKSSTCKGCLETGQCDNILNIIIDERNLQLPSNLINSENDKLGIILHLKYGNLSQLEIIGLNCFLVDFYFFG